MAEDTLVVPPRLCWHVGRGVELRRFLLQDLWRNTVDGVQYQSFWTQCALWLDLPLLMMFGGGWWKWKLSQLGCQSTLHTAGVSGQEAFGGVCVDQQDQASKNCLPGTLGCWPLLGRPTTGSRQACCLWRIAQMCAICCVELCSLLSQFWRAVLPLTTRVIRDSLCCLPAATTSPAYAWAV